MKKFRVTLNNGVDYHTVILRSKNEDELMDLIIDNAKALFNKDDNINYSYFEIKVA